MWCVVKLIDVSWSESVPDMRIEESLRNLTLPCWIFIDRRLRHYGSRMTKGIWALLAAALLVCWWGSRVSWTYCPGFQVRLLGMSIRLRYWVRHTTFLSWVLVCPGQPLSNSRRRKRWSCCGGQWIQCRWLSRVRPSFPWLERRDLASVCCWDLEEWTQWDDGLQLWCQRGGRVVSILVGRTCRACQGVLFFVWGRRKGGYLDCQHVSCTKNSK